MTGYFSWRLQGTNHGDLYRVERPDPEAPFGEPIAIDELNTPGHEFNPRASADGLSLVFVRWTTLDDINTADAYLAVRATAADPWTAAVADWSEPDRPDAAAGFIGDQTVVFDRSGELFFADRDAGELAPPQRLDINTASYDGIPFPARDGCELLFVSDRDTAALQLYSVRVAGSTTSE